MIDHTPDEIEAEFGRCTSLRWTDAHYFINDGVPLTALIHSPLFEFDFVVRDRVVFDNNKSFEFERHCSRANEAVAACLFLARDEWGDPLDIVAWRDDAVARWLGRAGVLGAEQIDMPRLDEPLATHASIRRWLRAGRHGIVVLDDHRAADMLRHEHLQVETSAFARDLRSQLTLPAPRISVVSAMKVAA